MLDKIKNLEGEPVRMRTVKSLSALQLIGQTMLWKRVNLNYFTDLSYNSMIYVLD